MAEQPAHKPESTTPGNDMSEVDYVLSRFDGLFGDRKDSRIILHGSREYARAIIERFGDSYRFEAVASAEQPSGAEFCGLPVISDDELTALHPDLVIMTERVRHAEAIYQSLGSACAEAGIALYDMYGLDWLALREEIDGHKSLLFDGWCDLIEPYDVVSFEVPDCLMHSRMNLTDGGWELVAKPVFKRLIERGTAQGKTFIYIGRGPFSPEEQLRALIDGGLVPEGRDEGLFFMRQGEDGCWHEICRRYSGKRILHIGHGIPKECVLPRYYGVDTHRLPYGDPANAHRKHMEVVETPPLIDGKDAPATLDDIEKAIDGSEAVSFDIFDTLLMRLTLDPSCVFGLVEQKARIAGIPADGFAERRMQIQAEANNPALEDIYSALRRDLGLSDEQGEWLRSCELDTERTVVVRRESIFPLFERAVAAGKHVVLTTDMYLPRPFLTELLESCGITGFERLYLSCDEGLLKQDGLLEKLGALCEDPEKIIHIGDSWERDVQPADALGIRWVQIPTVEAIARGCGYSPVLDRAASLSERILVGSCIARAFDDPFKPFAAGADEVRFTYLSFLPVLIGFLAWIFSRTAGKPLDGLLFSARDGWLPYRVFGELAQARPTWNLPRSVYFYTNRRAAFIPCSQKDRQMRLLEEKISHEEWGRRPEWMLSAYTGLDPQLVQPYEEGRDLGDYIRSHEEVLATNAATYKTRYETYLHRVLGDRDSGTYGFIDFVGIGTCQDFLQQWLPYKLHGYFFGRRDVDDRLDVELEAYCSEGLGYYCTNYMVLERYMTSLEPSLEGFTDEGDPLFAEEMRSRESLETIARVHGRALDYALWFFRLFDEPPEGISPALAMLMYDIGGSFGMDGEDYDDWGQHRI